MTMPTYPFDGCCEHGPNAHSKDRCLACGCSKPAVQYVAGGGPVTAPDELPDVVKCGLCKVLLDPADREGHLDHHERITNTIANLTAAVSALRHRQED